MKLLGVNSGYKNKKPIPIIYSVNLTYEINSFFLEDYVLNHLIKESVENYF